MNLNLQVLLYDGYVLMSSCCASDVIVICVFYHRLRDGVRDDARDGVCGVFFPLRHFFSPIIFLCVSFQRIYTGRSFHFMVIPGTKSFS